MSKFIPMIQKLNRTHYIMRFFVRGIPAPLYGVLEHLGAQKVLILTNMMEYRHDVYQNLSQ